MTTAAPEKPAFKPKDFESDQDVRWCPGCGDYSILAAVKRVLAKFDLPPEKYCFISGIGCSSRFPYYMNTYGIHSIHGRAPAVATGFKVINPDMQTWVITGDGDGFSIGGNHMLHVLRRNVDVKVLLFNNRIYGLTKGQYSPTSEQGKITKSTPMGSIDNPVQPLSFALAAEATFIARTVDLNIKHMTATLERAHEHKGTAFVEILQNCNIFNDGAWSFATDKDVKHDNVVELKQGEPLVYGKESDKGIRLNPESFLPEVVKLDGQAPEDAGLLVHDEKAPESVAYAMSRMMPAEGLPIPIGVFRCVERPVYEEQVNFQVAAAKEKKGVGDADAIQKLISGRATWTVDPENISEAVDTSSNVGAGGATPGNRPDQTPPQSNEAAPDSSSSNGSGS